MSQKTGNIQLVWILLYIPMLKWSEILSLSSEMKYVVEGEKIHLSFLNV